MALTGDCQTSFCDSQSVPAADDALLDDWRTAAARLSACEASLQVVLPNKIIHNNYFLLQPLLASTGYADGAAEGHADVGADDDAFHATG